MKKKIDAKSLCCGHWLFSFKSTTWSVLFLTHTYEAQAVVYPSTSRLSENRPKKSKDDQSACNSTPIWRNPVRKNHRSWTICRAEVPKRRESMHSGQDDLCGQAFFFNLSLSFSFFFFDCAPFQKWLTFIFHSFIRWPIEINFQIKNTSGGSGYGTHISSRRQRGACERVRAAALPPNPKSPDFHSGKKI